MPRCNLCLKNHAIRHCPVFVAKSIEARRDYIIKWDYCLNCLAHTHSRPVCESANRCAICGAKHHSMIHRERPHDVTFASFTEETIREAVEEAVAVEESEKESKCEVVKDDPHDLPYSLTPLIAIPPNWNHTIPPLVRVNLIHKGNPMWINLLLDPKREYSFLTRSVANLFPSFTPDYRRGAKEFGVFEVSPTYEPCEHQGPIACWHLLLKEVDIITPPPIADPRLETHFKSLKQKAHPHFASCREIDGVIGRRTLDIIMPDYTTHSNQRLPKVQRSIFGFIISGQWHGCTCH